MLKLLVVLTILIAESTSTLCRVSSFNRLVCRGRLGRVLRRGTLSRISNHSTILEISNTDISRFEAYWIEGIENITELKINFNDNLTALSSDSFTNLTKLLKLEIMFNNISTIENIAFYPLTKLEYLNLEYNNINHLPTGLFSNQKHLKILNLKHNKIREINSVVLNTLLNLEELNLSDNKLENLDERCLMSLENLIILNLSRNFISKLAPTLFQYQKRLKLLFLGVNNITYLDPSVFSKLTNLQNFTLRENHLNSIDFGKIKSLPNLRFLDLRNSRIPCDCSTMNFAEYCTERRIQLEITCQPSKTELSVNASIYFGRLDCSIYREPSLILCLILGLLLFSFLVDLFLSWLNYRYDLSNHRACSSISVNEYDYVNSFKDLEDKACRNAGGREDFGRYQSVLQKVMSVYDYLRPLPGRRLHEDSAKSTSNPPSYTLPPETDSVVYQNVGYLTNPSHHSASGASDPSKGKFLT